MIWFFVVGLIISHSFLFFMLGAMYGLKKGVKMIKNIIDKQINDLQNNRN